MQIASQRNGQNIVPFWASRLGEPGTCNKICGSWSNYAVVRKNIRHVLAYMAGPVWKPLSSPRIYSISPYVEHIVTLTAEIKCEPWQQRASPNPPFQPHARSWVTGVTTVIILPLPLLSFSAYYD